jgi:hypothetical protein
MRFKSVALASCVLVGLTVPTIAKAQSAPKSAMSKSNAMAAPSKAMSDSQQMTMPKHDSSMSKPSKSMSKPSKSMTPMQGTKPKTRKNQMSGTPDSGIARRMKADTAAKVKKPNR